MQESKPKYRVVVKTKSVPEMARTVTVRLLSGEVREYKTFNALNTHPVYSDYYAGSWVQASYDAEPTETEASYPTPGLYLDYTDEAGTHQISAHAIQEIITSEPAPTGKTLTCEYRALEPIEGEI